VTAARTDAVRAADAKRQRRRRRRKAGGKKRFRIFVDQDDLANALRGAGELEPGEHHHRIIESALQKQIDDWVDGWRGCDVA
jgi:hypothetical protein